MRDLRCRWCADWLLPSNVGNGYPYCNDECATHSLNYRWSIPTPVPLTKHKRSVIGSPRPLPHPQELPHR